MESDPGIYLEELEKNMNTSVRTADVKTEIPTG